MEGMGRGRRGARVSEPGGDGEEGRPVSKCSRGPTAIDGRFVLYPTFLVPSARSPSFPSLPAPCSLRFHPRGVPLTFSPSASFSNPRALGARLSDVFVPSPPFGDTRRREEGRAPPGEDVGADAFAPLSRSPAFTFFPIVGGRERHARGREDVFGAGFRPRRA